jgi:galactokinase
MSVAAHIQPVLARAREAFARQFGGSPVWGAAAPGRVNLIGEHTDYNDGFVLPIAIDRVCVAVGGPGGSSGRTRIWSEDVGEAAIADVSRPVVVGGVERGSWSSYILGVIAQFQRAHQVRNLDIAVASSVPLGAGLSSSASVEVAVATLLEEANGRKLDPLAKALLCQSAEHEFAGVPCGIMDQLVSVMGRAGHAALIDCRSRSVRQVAVPADVAILVVNSGVRHSLGAGEYAARRATCAAAAGKLGLRSLREAKLHLLDRGLSEAERRCARHVVSENLRVQAAVRALLEGDARWAGRVMAESHQSLRDDFGVSCVELDTLVHLSLTTTGVYGARMTGGGFGGCIVALVDPNRVVEFERRVRDGYRREHPLEGDVMPVTASDGAAVVGV